MTATTIRVQMAQRKDTAAGWTAANPILLSGEIGYETDTKKFKIGNGSTNWNSLAYLPIPDGSGNLTITGNLEIGTTGSLTFEGSTADGFETTLAVTNPTADRTITLPNVTGTVITSGDTGSVTSTMLADGTIVNADINSAAEIAVSKLANGTANQVIVTDGTNVSWSDNLTLAGDLTVNGTTTTINTQDLLVEDKNIIIGNVATPTDLTADGGGITLKGATDKTINWVDSTDAWTSSERFSYPLGSATAPSLTFTGDPNTGIYSPGADQVAISTNGTQKIVVDANGKVGIGGNGIGNGLGVYLQNGGGASVHFYEVSDGTKTMIAGADSGQDFVKIGALSNHPIGLVTNNGEKLRITTDGKLGLGTSSPAQSLHIKGSGDAKLLLNSSNNASDRGIYFATSTDSEVLGYIKQEYSTGKFEISSGSGSYSSSISFRTGGTADRVVIDSTGKVGIGFTVPEAALHAGGNSTSPVILAGANSDGLDITYKFRQSRGTITSPGDTGGEGVRLSFEKRASSAWASPIAEIYAAGDGSGATGYLEFLTKPSGGSATPRARIDSSGRLLVGTSSYTGNSKFAILGGAGVDIALLDLRFGGSRPTGADSGICEIRFGSPDQTSNNAYAKIECITDGASSSNTDLPARLVFSTTADGASSPTERMRIDSAGQTSMTNPVTPVLRIENSNNVSGDGAGDFVLRSNCGNTSSYHIRGNTNSVGNWYLYGNGTTSYSSDGRLKKNIETTRDGYLSDVMQLRVVKYNWKDQEDSTPRELGLIAQEVEQVFPGLIQDDLSPLSDEDPTLYKQLKASVLPVILLKALQEAVEKIKTLEAKVAALEGV